MTEPQYSRSDAAGDPGQPTGEIWRKEIHAHVDRYRTRRGRRIEGAFTMRFPFPPTETVAAAAVGEAMPATTGEDVIACADVVMATEAVETLVVASDGPAEVAQEPEAAALEVSQLVASQPETKPPMTVEPEVASATTLVEPEPPPVSRPRPRSKRKVIAFPRPLEGADVVHRLADPVLPEQPRILDVPEELEAFAATPYLDGLQFGPSPHRAPASQTDHIELPFRAAALSQRVYAAFIDCALVGVATAAFGAVGYKMLPRLIVTKPLLLTAATVPVLFWAIYQYLLTVYAGTTVGMRVAGIGLSTFKGARPKWHTRRTRVLALYFSAASMSMGLLWALVDVDKLCWHDRISRTYLAKR
jgi:uncharacterized RDD family membrane protein YckC